MIKKLFFIVLISTALFPFSGCRKKNTNLIYDRKYIKEIKALRNEIFFYLSRNMIPGGNFAISIKGKTIYSEGIGQASKDLNVRATRETLFRIGDNSELITALIFRRLVSDGRLHPDSSIQYYYPEFPVKQSGITLENLVSHTSGFREPTEEELGRADLFVSLEKGLERFKDDPLAVPTGYYQLLSAYNYNLLGMVMEKATGKKYSQLAKEYVLDTLLMHNTVEDNIFATINNRSDYFENNLVSHVLNATSKDLRCFSPSRGLLSNAEDLLKLGNAILYSRLVPGGKENYLKMPQVKGEFPTRFANGWLVSTDRTGKKFFGKTGNVNGGGSAVLVFPDEEIVIAAATNLSMRIDEIPIFDYAYKFIKNKSAGEESSPDKNPETEKQQRN